MSRITLAVLSTAFISTTAYALEVTPDKVAFDEDGQVQTSLTGVAGDPVAGKLAFTNRKQGNCLACHVNSDASDESFHGEVGPALDGVAGRWDEAQLRGIVANSKMTFDGTIMPAFYRVGGERILEDFVGTTILTAQQVEDVVAYLKTLKEE
jgi:L-cysteine S-thiosulfotransferase